MPMERDSHEQLLSELMGQPTEERKTEILQQLRADYSTVIHDHTNLTESERKLKLDKEDLLIANGRLFRENGIFVNDKEKDEKVEQQTFSETVTLESILK